MALDTLVAVAEMGGAVSVSDMQWVLYIHTKKRKRRREKKEKKKPWE